MTGTSDFDQRRRAALAVPIRTILEHEGINPIQGRGNRYLSPFREEKNGSFYVYPEKNIWMDFGLCETHRGGDTINLIERLLGLGYREAVEYILSLEGSTSCTTSPRLTGADRPDEPKQRIEYICPITNPGLVRFLRGRCIDIDVARRYCREVHYVFLPTGKSFFGIGFPNDKGGWVIRSAPYPSKPHGDKLDIIAHGISTIRLNGSAAGPSAYVFEGFLNFLSWVILYGCPDKDVIVLNSAENAQALDGIATSGVRELICYPDNDAKGRKAYEHIRAHSGCAVYDEAFYAREGLNDLNDYLKSMHTQKKHSV